MANRTKLTPEKKAEFCKLLEQAPNVTAAARACGIARRTFYDARDKDAEFAAAWDEAIAESIDNAEAELYRRAVTGTERPVFQGKQLVGHIREYSDTCLIFWLKAHRPEKYRDNASVQHQGGVTVEVITGIEGSVNSGGGRATGGCTDA